MFDLCMFDILCFQWVIPEMVGQCLSTMLMLVSMHWFIFLLNLPVAAWNIYRYAHISLFSELAVREHALL